METLDINKFKNWLQSFEPQDIVGWPRTSTHCPLTFFLTKKFGGGINMGPAITLLNDERLEIDTTGWANDFMSWADSMFPKHQVLTAQQCLDWIGDSVN